MRKGMGPTIRARRHETLDRKLDRERERVPSLHPSTVLKHLEQLIRTSATFRGEKNSQASLSWQRFIPFVF